MIKFREYHEIEEGKIASGSMKAIALIQANKIRVLSNKIRIEKDSAKRDALIGQQNKLIGYMQVLTRK